VYYHDPATGQYFYPDPAQQAQQPQQAQHPAVAAAAALEAALAEEASRGGGGPGGIRIKEISGASLRAMDPAQRAELAATRSALGADYEGRLRAEAGRVGDVSKRAKSKHQLSSLYVQAKEMELEQLEKVRGEGCAMCWAWVGCVHQRLPGARDGLRVLRPSGSTPRQLTAPLLVWSRSARRG
jgi:hypothetical protein